MKYYELNPDVAGQLGNNTIVDATIYPRKVISDLDYEFLGWFGSDLVETYPISLVTDALAKALTKSGSGTFTLKDVSISISPEAEELARKLQLSFPASTGSTSTALQEQTTSGSTL